MAALTGEQLLGVGIATRMSSVVSILGSLFIIGSYLCLPYFRRPTTRLIFYATWGNLLTNVATLVSVSAIPGGAVSASPLCQVQAFLIQWFMLADPFWVFCMALNVGLIFKVKRFDGSKMPDYEKWYGLVAYGVPAVVPITYLVHDQVSSHGIVGPAILWCWVRKEFDWMRITLFYAPMWILAVATMSIHMWVGLKIYRAKMEMRRCLQESQQRLAQACPSTLEDPFVDPQDQITVTTNISHENVSRRTALLVPLNPNSPVRYHKPLLMGKYRATAYAAPLASGDFATLPSPQVPVFRPSEHAAHVQRREETSEAFRYFKSALLLFVALVVVWVPSSANRLYQLGHPERASFALNLISALVLPTQGFWNAVIYAQASWDECKRAWAGFRRGESGGSTAGVARELSSMDPSDSKLTV
ncbi:uncharacterized protein M421DRAFT_246 [Didymella exigua CBS 183.55]|uniref:G-protein coupled receptors family 2 profile 2 domain-containing protein n=1 Tax=Didymella exigua CBS 183.55 TaxID=1150837 RepID=A0A6A5S042_9PLEO|nr:uncharacterized protein M421DRAFT_246 [Didymella exigua CBS 183.55]KAF1934085.1 hypothetical protein M421DRAFT_246 [Didymella exigua CBS 183.55]